MKHVEYCVCKDGWMMGTHLDNKAQAEQSAARYADKYPESKIEIKVNVYEEMK